MITAGSSISLHGGFAPNAKADQCEGGPRHGCSHTDTCFRLHRHHMPANKIHRNHQEDRDDTSWLRPPPPTPHPTPGPHRARAPPVGCPRPVYHCWRQARAPPRGFDPEDTMRCIFELGLSIAQARHGRDTERWFAAVAQTRRARPQPILRLSSTLALPLSWPSTPTTPLSLSTPPPS